MRADDYIGMNAESVCLSVCQHKAIVSFPSVQFYADRLSIGSELQAQPSTMDFWPAGGDEPIAFVHIEGLEQTVAVLGDDGSSEMSVSNADEVVLVVSDISNIHSLSVCLVFLQRDATQSAVVRLYVVCPSVTFRYCDHIGWNTSKIISRSNSVRSMLTLALTWAIWCNGNIPKIRVE